MSKAKFAAAKELIDEGQYKEARSILRTIDHPTARQWEAKLDKLEATPKHKRTPSANQPKPKAVPKKSGSSIVSNGVRGCLILIVVLVVVLILTPSSKTESPNATATSRPDVRPTNTQGQAAAIVSTATTFNADPIVTVSSLSRGFVTITPAPGTVYPTATITDTPVPTITFTDGPTNTALPTETPQPQLTSVTNSLYDVISTANARNCPDSNCDLIGKFQKGDLISVLGVVSGENYKGSSVWVQAIYHDGQTVYVHSSLVTPHVDYVQPVQPTSAFIQSAPQQISQPTQDISAGHTALCGDGTYSDSAHKRGTCSHHGGVAQWLKDVPS